MQKIFSSLDAAAVNHYKNLLEAQGIQALIKNLYLAGGVGNIPMNECWLELWVVDNNATQQAKAIIETSQQQSMNKDVWKCNNCGEVLEPQFLQCWKCGQAHN